MRHLMLAMLLACAVLAVLSWIHLPRNDASSVVVAIPHNASSSKAAKTARHRNKSPKELLCELKTRARLRTVDGSEEPFSSMGWSRLVPSDPLEPASDPLVPSSDPLVPASDPLVPASDPLVPSSASLVPSSLRGNGSGGFFRSSCAVVSSAGAMLRSALGEEIDAHDAVMRFNHAPTAGYESDVGSRTTFRLVNKQILHNRKFRFRSSALYRDNNVTLVAWERPPRGDRLDLLEWYADGEVFGPYVERRVREPAQPFYVLHPGYVRQLWQAIRGSALAREGVKGNPPSSGFIGILVMMALCDEVHVYEFIPSVRRRALCHYFEPGENMGCSVGSRSNWHPLLFEKRLIRRINTGSEADLQRGRVTLPGFSKVNCD